MVGLKEYVTKLKIIISEVDGILTEGHFYYDELTNVPLKRYNFKDFEAINVLKKHFKVAFVSSDNKINYNLMRNKNIPFYYDPKNKRGKVLEILRRYNYKPDEALYLGSTFSDIECMNLIPFAMCPEDAVPEIKERSLHVFSIFGGMGIFCDLYSLLKPEIRKRLVDDE